MQRIKYKIVHLVNITRDNTQLCWILMMVGHPASLEYPAFDVCGAVKYYFFKDYGRCNVIWYIGLN